MGFGNTQDSMRGEFSPGMPIAMVVVTAMSRSVAPYFARLTDLDGIQVLPPYESAERANQWVRGYLRLPDGGDFIITGPRLRLCFSGCRWNKMVFAMVGVADEEGYQFQRWLSDVAESVEKTIWANPDRFKPGAKSNSRFTFDHDIVKPSSDPASFPDQLSCRLSSLRRQRLDDSGEFDEIVDAELFRVEDGISIKMDPAEITADSEVIPIIRLTYFRNVDRFGLTATILKAQVFPSEGRQKMDNAAWEFDLPMDTSV